MKAQLSVILFAILAPLVARGQRYQLVHAFIHPPRAPIAELLEAGDGYFYSTTTVGGRYNQGTVFRISFSGKLTIIHSFVGTDGSNPSSRLIRGGNGKFYGTTSSGGVRGQGTVFAIDTDGNVTVLHSFRGKDGSSPVAGLVQGTDGMFYGTTSFGGAGYDGTQNSGYGAIFKIDPSGHFVRLHSFAVSDGFIPVASLIQGSDGNFYGTTQAGGTSFNGTVFKVDRRGNVTTLHNFAGAPSDGSGPSAALKQGSDGSFYGDTAYGGASGNGTIFKMDVLGNLSTLYSFKSGAPYAGLTQGSDGNFYGTTPFGGRSDQGTVFKITPSGHLTILHVFKGQPSDGSNPLASVVEARDGNFYGTTYDGGSSGLGAIFRLTPSGKTFSVLHSLRGAGTYPTSPLTQAGDGNLYGVTGAGGPRNDGTIFKIDRSAHVTTLHSFSGSDGRFIPGEFDDDGTLIEGSDGNLYGNTWAGGSKDKGTLFKLDLSGTLTSLYSFTGCNNDAELCGGDSKGGANPDGGLIEDGEGNFYGTTDRGGVTTRGTAFKMDRSGNVTTIHYFVEGPYPGPLYPHCTLIQGKDGNFYGTTIQGGVPGFGTVFKMDPLGVVTVIHAFLGHTDTTLDGGYPEAGLIEGSDGQFYGTTLAGGKNDSGTVFTVDSLGNYKLLHSFVNKDGSRPSAPLIQGADGSLYGTTAYGGPGSRPKFPLDGNGTVFKIDHSGVLTTLHFFSGVDGRQPSRRLLEANDKNLYGTTKYGGSSDAGVVFRVVLNQ
jgi:uncharacterized repeat protein (TIGR03803 family)